MGWGEGVWRLVSFGKEGSGVFGRGEERGFVCGGGRKYLGFFYFYREDREGR